MRVAPLRHRWSLSTEEQLYLLWPVLVLFGIWPSARSRIGGQPTVLGLLAVVGIGSLCRSVVLTATEPALAHLSIFNRLWQLAAPRAGRLRGHPGLPPNEVLRGWRSWSQLAHR